MKKEERCTSRATETRELAELQGFKRIAIDTQAVESETQRAVVETQVGCN